MNATLLVFELLGALAGGFAAGIGWERHRRREPLPPPRPVGPFGPMVVVGTARETVAAGESVRVDLDPRGNAFFRPASSAPPETERDPDELVQLELPHLERPATVTRAELDAMNRGRAAVGMPSLDRWVIPSDIPAEPGFTASGRTSSGLELVGTGPTRQAAILDALRSGLSPEDLAPICGKRPTNGESDGCCFPPGHDGPCDFEIE